MPSPHANRKSLILAYMAYMSCLHLFSSSVCRSQLSFRATNSKYTGKSNRIKKHIRRTKGTKKRARLFRICRWHSHVRMCKQQLSPAVSGFVCMQIQYLSLYYYYSCIKQGVHIQLFIYLLFCFLRFYLLLIVFAVLPWLPSQCSCCPQRDFHSHYSHSLYIQQMYVM